MYAQQIGHHHSDIEISDDRLSHGEHMGNPAQRSYIAKPQCGQGYKTEIHHLHADTLIGGAQIERTRVVRLQEHVSVSPGESKY